MDKIVRILGDQERSKVKKKIQKKVGRRWTWRSPDGNTKNEIDYIISDKPSMVTDVTVKNRINIGGDHSVVMGSITLNTRAERRKLLNKNTRTRVDTQMIGTKNTFQLEMKNRFKHIIIYNLALMKKRREIEKKTSRDHLEYVEICKTIKKKAGEDIRKHN